MAKRKGKQVSFDAMVKFFIRNYNIPTTKDVEKLMNRMDRLEELVKNMSDTRKSRRVGSRVSAKAKAASGRAGMAASDTVFNVIKRSRRGIGFTDIKVKTGFDEKKLRNIVFRLDKLGRIKRVSRGVYAAS